MGVRIRLARFGRTHMPFYRIFVSDSRSPRDGKHLEVVGTYDPVPQRDGNKHVALNLDRIKYNPHLGVRSVQSASLYNHLCGTRRVCQPTNIERYWISVGAQPSERVAKILGQAGVLPKPPLRGPTQTPTK